MKSRVGHELPGLETSPHISTFHSFCYGVLLKRHFERKLLDKVDIWIFLRRRMEQLGLEYYQKLAAPGAFAVETLWVAGGLYGNRFALDRLLELYDAEPGPKALVFNGDFHWFDVEPQDFAYVNRAVLARRATRGNVETELAEPHAGTGGGGHPEKRVNRRRQHEHRCEGERARTPEMRSQRKGRGDENEPEQSDRYSRAKIVCASGGEDPRVQPMGPGRRRAGSGLR